MKKILLFLIIGALMCLTACGELPDNSAGIKFRLFVLDAAGECLFEKEQSTTSSSLFDALDEFDQLEISSTTSHLGAYLNSVSIGTKSQSGFSESARIESGTASYIAVFHDIDDIKLKDLSPDSDGLIFGQKTYFYSGVSINLLPLYDGASYVLKLVTF